MVRTAHPTARSIHLTDFSCFEAPPRGWVQVPAKPPPYTPCGCEIRVQKGSNPSNTAPPAVGCAVRTKEKISDAALFPDVSGRYEMGKGVGCAFDGVEENGAHGAPTARSIHPADFSGFKLRSSVGCTGTGRTATVHPMRLRNPGAKGSNPRQHGSTCGRVRRAHQRKNLRRCTFPRCFRTTRRCSPAWRRRPTPAGPPRSVRPRP